MIQLQIGPTSKTSEGDASRDLTTKVIERMFDICRGPSMHLPSLNAGLGHCVSAGGLQGRWFLDPF